MLPQDRTRSLQGLRILLVEDSDDVRELLTLLLGSDGAEVSSAPCARAAVGVAVGWDFDVLLTNIGLPDVAGNDLIREILGMKTSRPRVVVMTGFGEPHIGLVRRAGADAVFTKPLEWSDLREQLALGHPAALAA
jgi:DNA-binding response OmpR family regulator